MLNHVGVPHCTLDATFQRIRGRIWECLLPKERNCRRIDCSFITEKSRTALLQFVSVTRLELQAAKIALRMHHLILKGEQPGNVCFILSDQFKDNTAVHQQWDTNTGIRF